MKNWDSQAMREELFRKLACDAELADQLRKVKVEYWAKVFEMGFRSGWKAGQERIEEITLIPNTPTETK